MGELKSIYFYSPTAKVTRYNFLKGGEGRFEIAASISVTSGGEVLSGVECGFTSVRMGRAEGGGLLRRVCSLGIITVDGMLPWHLSYFGVEQSDLIGFLSHESHLIGLF
jgi:hypothetical protein